MSLKDTVFTTCYRADSGFVETLSPIILFRFRNSAIAGIVDLGKRTKLDAGVEAALTRTLNRATTMQFVFQFLGQVL